MPSSLSAHSSIMRACSSVRRGTRRSALSKADCAASPCKLKHASKVSAALFCGKIGHTMSAGAYPSSCNPSILQPNSSTSLTNKFGLGPGRWHSPAFHVFHINCIVNWASLMKMPGMETFALFHVTSFGVEYLYPPTVRVYP